MSHACRSDLSLEALSESAPGEAAGILSPRSACFTVCQPTFERKPRVKYYDPVPPLGDPQIPFLDASQGFGVARLDGRRSLVEQFDRQFKAAEASGAIDRLDRYQQRAYALLSSSKTRDAFDLAKEPDRVRDRYGRNLFGQGCLLARRLVERGVPFVEVNLSSVPGAPAGWDTHQNNFASVKALCGVLDPAWASLLDDLKQRGLLETTMVVWMGEFGRTPRLNPAGGGGRDHFPNAWSVVLGGGGIKGGQVIGKTSDDGSTVEERKVEVEDFLATAALALGIDIQNLAHGIEQSEQRGILLTQHLPLFFRLIHLFDKIAIHILVHLIF